MEVVLLEKARKDRDYWKKTGNVSKWSRRINNEHRMVYSISSGRIYIYVFSLKGHYL